MVEKPLSMDILFHQRKKGLNNIKEVRDGMGIEVPIIIKMAMLAGTWKE